MRSIKGQRLGGTAVDSHGEQVPFEVLSAFVERYKGAKQPLNQAHDLRMRSVGYIENFRLAPDPLQSGEWILIGDVYYDTENLEVALGGFSISYLEMARVCTGSQQLIVYLPFPYYNDDELTEELVSTNTSVGKWVKKAANPTVIAMIGATIVFAIKPVWEDLYKAKVAPVIYEFFASHYKKLEEKRISADVVQTVSYKGREIQVVLIPIRGKESSCFSVVHLDRAMQLVSELLCGPGRSDEIVRIHLYFHDEAAGFQLDRSESVTGDVQYYA